MAEARTDGARVRRGTHPVDEVLPPGRMVAFGLQHVMTMYAGIIAVPLIVATAIGLPPGQLVYIINVRQINKIANLEDLMEKSLVGAGGH